MRHAAIVTEIQPLAPNVLQLTVSFQDAFAFEPGQWVNFRFPEGVSRAYTIASSARCIATASPRPSGSELATL